LKDGYAEDAEKLYREALALEPDAPDLKNNLTAALMAQGREEEGIALLEEIHAQSPDYLFGRVGLARVALRDGNLEKAKALMEPLMNRRRFHVSEFRAWVQTQIEMSLFQKQKDGARTWLEIWEAELPEDPMIPAYRRRIR
jgi:predicted Zn-dependent protease